MPAAECRRLRPWPAACAAALLLAAAAPAGAAWETGGGMEYYSVQTYARDDAGRSFQTLLQTTLAKTAFTFTHGDLTVHAEAGLSDWNTSGEWRGSGIIDYDIESLYTWVWQQEIQAEARVGIGGGLAAGAAVYDRTVEHYYPGDLRYLRFRLRAYDALLDWTMLRRPNLTVGAAVGYSPTVHLAWYQDTGLGVIDPVLETRDSQGLGTRWWGRVRLHYRDSGGWGVDFFYQAGFARFPDPRDLAEITLRSGRLTGVFVLVF